MSKQGEEFLAPYQFVRATGKVGDKPTPTTDFKKIAAGEVPYVRHDRWDEGSYSGRLVATLTTVTPTVLGAEQTAGTDEKVGEVKPYRAALPGKPLAVPGSALRGMLGTIAETISQSALRRLEDREYSVRKEMEDALRAVGMIELRNGAWHLRPLCLVTAKLSGGRVQFDRPWEQVFKDQPLSQCLSAYVGQYEGREKRVRQGNSFLDSIAKGRQRYGCWHRHTADNYVYAKLDDRLNNISLDKGMDVLERGDALHLQYDERNNRYTMLLGQQIGRDGQDVISNSEWVRKSEYQRAQYRRGVLFMLGIDGRETEIPRNKKHELFIPMPEGRLEENGASLPLSEAAVENFEALVRERLKISAGDGIRLPFFPDGYDDDQRDKQPLRDGDLVYFDVNKTGNQVREIAFSSIWRCRAELRSAHQCFSTPETGGNNALPWGSEGRDALTPAECLFGVVEFQRDKTQKIAHNLASRLRFADALPLADFELIGGEGEVLKILASPKPPSPSMYFHTANGGVSKKNLAKEKTPRPNGRKFYLHHRKADVDAESWVTADADERKKQKLRVWPLPEGVCFSFHIDFENLSAQELTLLCAALEPDWAVKKQGEFMHRIGLGKPLGLGSVEIQLAGVFLVNRQQRYASDALTAPRYHQWIAGSLDAWDKALGGAYSVELSAMNDKDRKAEFPKADELIDEKSLHVLRAIGSRQTREQSLLPVSYPYALGRTKKEDGRTVRVDDQKPHPEDEGFAWFVENKEAQRPGQYLQAVDPGKRQALPTLNAGVSHPPDSNSGSFHNGEKPGKKR